METKNPIQKGQKMNILLNILGQYFTLILYYNIQGNIIVLLDKDGKETKAFFVVGWDRNEGFPEEVLEFTSYFHNLDLFRNQRRLAYPASTVPNFEPEFELVPLITEGERALLRKAED